MQVERFDIYDFKVTLSETEFAEVKALSETQDITPEEVVKQFLYESLEYIKQDGL